MNRSGTESLDLSPMTLENDLIWYRTASEQCIGMSETEAKNEVAWVRQEADFLFETTNKRPSIGPKDGKVPYDGTG